MAIPLVRARIRCAWFGSVISVATSAFSSAPASAVVNRDPPTISKPGERPASPNIRAKGASVKPCSTTVASTRTKASGPKSAPSSTPRSRSCSPNRPATAISTTPRGPVNATKARSFKGSLVPISDARTVIGRAMKTTAATNSAARQSSRAIWPKSIEAANRINTPETRRIVACSLNRRSSVIEGRSALAITTPITVTANRPLSCNRLSVAANTPRMLTNSTGTFIYSGTQPRRKLRASSAATAQPIKAATQIPRISIPAASPAGTPAMLTTTTS